MKHKEQYDDEFYRDRYKQTVYAADTILRIVRDEQGGGISSVVDVGCGVGAWLKEAQKVCLADRIQGYDGDYVNRKYLVIPKENFKAYNLESRLPDKEYDLAISLEVAEHLSKERAESFVDDLCNMSDRVLFSAATVKQGGVGHVNEQRLSYWIKKFRDRGYSAHDIIRPKIWNDKKIPVWYRQNIMLFIKSENWEIPKEAAAGTSTEKKYPYCESGLKSTEIPDIIHPDLYEEKCKQFDSYMDKAYFKFYFFLKDVYRKIKRRH